MYLTIVRMSHRLTSAALRGFTLIEMITVVILIGVASAIVLPGLGTRDDLKTLSAARQLSADLTFAQSRAVATQKILYVAFDLAGNRYRVLDAMDPPHVIADPALTQPLDRILGAGALKGVQLETADFDGGHVLAFDAMGMPYGYCLATGFLTPLKSGSVILRERSQTLTVSIEPGSGQTKIR